MSWWLFSLSMQWEHLQSLFEVVGAPVLVVLVELLPPKEWKKGLKEVDADVPKAHVLLAEAEDTKGVVPEVAQRVDLLGKRSNVNVYCLSFLQIGFASTNVGVVVLVRKKEGGARQGGVLLPHRRAVALRFQVLQQS